MTDPFAEFNAGTKRAREDYYRRPISTSTNSLEHRARHDCIRCGDTTRAASGLCLTCRTKDRL